MRYLVVLTITIMIPLLRISHAETIITDEVSANSALIELHNLAIANARFEQATKDFDNFGCQSDAASLNEAAHNAFQAMHAMSVIPVDAMNLVSEVLRLSPPMSTDGCPSSSMDNFQSMMIGQAIISLRWDYAIGDTDWYMVDSDGSIQAKNPYRYAKALREQNYAWVSTRPKDMTVMVETDWKSELASSQIDDEAIDNSGSRLERIEVDYRKNPDDDVSVVDFYRSKDSAKSIIEETRKQADADNKMAMEQQAASDAWGSRLSSLQYMVANRDIGFKLVYAACRKHGKANQAENECSNDGSYDYSEGRRLPYLWFSTFDDCENVQFKLVAKPPSNIKLGSEDVFTSDCIPAPKLSRSILAGYQMVFAITAPGSDTNHSSYVDLRDSSSKTAIVFEAFSKCYKAMSGAYSRVERDLGVDGEGNLLGDKTKAISLVANCVRTYDH